MPVVPGPRRPFGDPGMTYVALGTARQEHVQFGPFGNIASGGELKSLGTHTFSRHEFAELPTLAVGSLKSKRHAFARACFRAWSRVSFNRGCQGSFQFLQNQLAFQNSRWRPWSRIPSGSARLSGDHENWNFGRVAERTKISAKFKAIELRHLEVQQNGVGLVLQGQGQSVLRFSGFEIS